MNRAEIIPHLQALRERFIAAFEALEPAGKFKRKPWVFQKGSGGGEIGLLRGDVFEKAAVNWSAITTQESLFATGVSLVTHMANPKAPTAHFNIRYIKTPEKEWVGGGFDLTPMGFPFEEDTKHFHAVAQKALAPFGKDLYEKFSSWAREYFTIWHYGKERGVGGIFFDNLHSADFGKDLEMWRSVGNNFLEAILPIYQKRIAEPFTEEDRRTQLQRRARYVEFNLLYDRGTKFGFESGGNPEAILCSLPPLAAW